MMGVFWAPPPARRSLMSHSTTARLRSQLPRLTSPPAPQPELGLDGILPQATVVQVRTAEGATGKEVLYTPWVTFWTFFWPMLSPDRSCRWALKRLSAWMSLRGQELHDEDTSPSCKARARLPEAALRRLMRWLGSQTHHQAAEPWPWCGRKVKVVDGSTVLRPDPVANQP